MTFLRRNRHQEKRKEDTAMDRKEALSAQHQQSGKTKEQRQNLFTAKDAKPQ